MLVYVTNCGWVGGEGGWAGVGVIVIPMPSASLRAAGKNTHMTDRKNSFRPHKYI
jgi:hypothetical protein